jgi:hypothetical protein
LPLVIKFKVWGALRFLSHAEMLRLFRRACVRAGISVRYSQGFNPRPKLSLPLPRPVGVESDQEVLTIRVENSNVGLDVPHHRQFGGASPTLHRIESDLSVQLPEGCELISVSVAESKASIQPRSATYVLPVWPECLNDDLRATIDRLLASESLTVRREAGAGGRKVKNIDVRAFLASIQIADEGIIVECRVGPAGSIRIDEVLSLLQLDQKKLAGPIRRAKVQWKFLTG